MTPPPDVASWGAFALGIFIAWLTWYFVRRLEDHTPAGLVAIVGVVAGGTVVAFLDVGSTAQGSTEHRWWYPIGLVVGFVLYALINWIVTGQPPTQVGRWVARFKGAGVKGEVRT